jgi:hypothetical protein
MRLEQLCYLLEESPHYSGKVLETGGTSTKFPNLAPGLQWLISNNHIKQGQTILDLGAGKFARNADVLRKKGFKVWAYDPFNHNGSEGWAIGSVSDSLPHDVQFDVAFSAFVLNVVPKYLEDQILAQTKQLNAKTFHLTRNLDIFDSVKAALNRKDRVVYPFFQKEFLMQDGGGPVTTKDMTDAKIMEFCKFGVQTSKGFQRIPFLEEDGYKLIRKTRDYKIYSE